MRRTLSSAGLAPNPGEFGRMGSARWPGLSVVAHFRRDIAQWWLIPCSTSDITPVELTNVRDDSWWVATSGEGRKHGRLA
jgi:hypothetical protein